MRNRQNVYVDMCMDLLKNSPLNEKYCHLMMEGLAAIYKFPGGIQEPYTIR